ncbi:MAG: DUF3795 domain-containing protein [Solidesulfovibrio sp. DCME]|uniref:DUF3795 domain-containing protein n=1 Tax=Solidesulfovibrio sp. DCME TaxID=3447380 RepID=UPI003D0F7F41
MDREALLRRIAPCGLDCGRCLDNPDSPIVRHARALRGELGGFGHRAPFFAAMDPAFAAYAAFEALLDRLGRASCRGCREGQCLLASCRVKDCVGRHGVDFCHACPEFETCDPGLPEGLTERWRANNRRLAEMGLAAYADWVATKPRY